MVSPTLQKLLGPILAAAVGAGAAIGAGSHSSASQLDKIVHELAEVRSDVRLLKCVNGFPGDCPGQAHAP